MLGSHIAERLRRRNWSVRAVCRVGSDVTFLSRIGVQLVSGDLTDRSALGRACEGVDAVFHAAGASEIGGLGLISFAFPLTELNTSSTPQRTPASSGFCTSARSAFMATWTAPARFTTNPRRSGANVHRWSYYTRAKVEAEHRVATAHKSGKIRATILRPSWLYGPRDRATLPRLIESIRSRKLRVIGDGTNRLNVVHAANVAEASVLAVESDRAIGEAYNCSHDGVLTQRRYFDLVADALGEPRVTRMVPYRAAYGAAFGMECLGHLFRASKPPLVTRYAVWLMGRRCFFECDKIKEHLGWSPTIGYEQGVPEAVREYIPESRLTGRVAARPPQPVAETTAAS